MSYIAQTSRIVGKKLLVIALGVFLLLIVTPTLDAQRSRAMTISGKIEVSEPGKTPPWVAFAITHPTPQYPYADRMLQHEGSGVFRLIIDPKTGVVGRVLVEKSSGYKTLDDSAIKAYQQWRWKPGTWKKSYFL